MTYLGEDIDKLKREHLEAFVADGVHEATTFEGKGGDGLPGSPHKYAKAITGFLNTDGGVLWIGAPREEWVDTKDLNKGKEFTGRPKGHGMLTKDRIRRILLTEIQPEPVGVKLSEPIQMDDGTYSTVVEVSPSDYPPHQVKGVYYLRVDGETRPAPHGLVEALFYRRRGPLLVPELQKLSYHYDRNNGMMELRTRLTVKNVGRGSAQDYAIEFAFGGAELQREHLTIRNNLSTGPNSFVLGPLDFGSSFHPHTPAAMDTRFFLDDMHLASKLHISLRVSAVEMVTATYEYVMAIGATITDAAAQIIPVKATTIDGEKLAWPPEPEKPLRLGK